mgnify:CR=1 FL=1
MTTDREVAAERRADWLRALRVEREGYVLAGKQDRVAAVDAEIARMEGRPVGRSEVPVEPAPRARRARP